VLVLYSAIPGVSKLQPGGQIQPAKSFHPACKDTSSTVRKQRTYEKFVDLAECNISRKNDIT